MPYSTLSKTRDLFFIDLKGEKGQTLIIVLLVMSIVVLITAGVTLRVTSDIRSTADERASAMAIGIGEAALEELLVGEDGVVDVGICASSEGQAREFDVSVITSRDLEKDIDILRVNLEGYSGNNLYVCWDENNYDTVLEAKVFSGNPIQISKQRVFSRTASYSGVTAVSGQGACFNIPGISADDNLMHIRALVADVNGVRVGAGSDASGSLGAAQEKHYRYYGRCNTTYREGVAIEPYLPDIPAALEYAFFSGSGQVSKE